MEERKTIVFQNIGGRMRRVLHEPGKHEYQYGVMALPDDFDPVPGKEYLCLVKTSKTYFCVYEGRRYRIAVARLVPDPPP